MRFGKRETAVDGKPLADVPMEKLVEDIQNAVGLSIFLKDRTREAEAKSIVKALVPKFKGELYSKASEFGWVVGQELEPTRDDSTTAQALIQELASQ